MRALQVVAVKLLMTKVGAEETALSSTLITKPLAGIRFGSLKKQVNRIDYQLRPNGNMQHVPEREQRGIGVIIVDGVVYPLLASLRTLMIKPV
jgi:hypothetical protein